jgi:hypothetical protein
MGKGTHYALGINARVFDFTADNHIVVVAFLENLKVFIF